MMLKQGHHAEVSSPTCFFHPWQSSLDHIRSWVHCRTYTQQSLKLFLSEGT